MNPHHIFPGPGGPQNFHNIPPRQHGHGQAPINQPVAVYGHQLESNQGLPPPIQTASQSGLIQPPPPATPYGINIMPFQTAVPVQNVNGQPGINFSGQPVGGPSIKDAFPTNIDPGTLPPPPSQSGQAGTHLRQFIPVSTSDYSKFGMAHHIYTGKVPDMSSDMPPLGGGGQGVQTMLLPSVSAAQNLIGVEGSGHGSQQVRPGLVSLGTNPSDSIFGIHISQLGGLSSTQVEEMDGGSSTANTGGLGKFQSGSNLECFSFHHLCVDSPNSLSSGGSVGSSTVVTPSTSYIVMAPGVFSASNENINPNSSGFSSARGGGGTGGVVPIGTERAQKSATLSGFPIITSGIVIIIILWILSSIMYLSCIQDSFQMYGAIPVDNVSLLCLLSVFLFVC